MAVNNATQSRLSLILAGLASYIAITKPRVMSLLLFTAVGGAFLGSRGAPNISVLVAVLLGGALASGGAASLNMAIESNLDRLMGRTKGRPVAQGKIGKWNAMAFGILLNVLAFATFLLLTNWLAAVLAISGTLLYVIVYTLILKRTTTQNIVIGGAAGALPPLVGYAAATSTLTLEAYWLAAIIFFWTPPHFWALAIMIKNDYARANIPMLPVVEGEDATRTQIFLYSILLFTITAGLGAFQLRQLTVQPLGIFYMIGSSILGIGLLWYAIRLLRSKSRTSAWTLYRYSLLYMFLLFTVIMVDASVDTF